MITERAIHNYLKWLEEQKEKAYNEAMKNDKSGAAGSAMIESGKIVAFSTAIRRLKKLL